MYQYPQEFKRSRYNGKGQAMPTIKSKFPYDFADRINGKTGYTHRGNRTVQNVEWIDPTLFGEVIMRTYTLPDVNINHRRENCLSHCITL